VGGLFGSWAGLFGSGGQKAINDLISYLSNSLNGASDKEEAVFKTTLLKRRILFFHYWRTFLIRGLLPGNVEVFNKTITFMRKVDNITDNMLNNKEYNQVNEQIADNMPSVYQYFKSSIRQQSDFDIFNEDTLLGAIKQANSKIAKLYGAPALEVELNKVAHNDIKNLCARGI
jgi:hypothetical protein